jgi:integrase
MITKRTAKDGAISWQVYSRATGTKRYVGSYGTERAAKDALQDHEVRQRAIARGELPPEIDERRTLEIAVEAWLASLKTRKSRSWKTYTFRMTAILRALGKMPIEQIRQAHVMALRDEMALSRSPRTVNAAIMTLSSAFGEFIKRQWVDKNPCIGVGSVASPQQTFNWLKTSDEIGRLIAACPAGLSELVAMLFGTGMRIDELLHLQWADVDLDPSKRLLTVHRGRQGPAKSGRVRHVPILDSVLPVLRRMALQRGGAVLLFPNRWGRVRTSKGVLDAFRAALARAGLDPTLRVHDARHTFASHWVANGGDLWRLSKVLGHSSVTITERFYAHLRPEAYAQDYARVTFAVPGPVADVVPLRG